MANYLLDTNIVLRLMDQEAAEHAVCREAIETLTAAGHLLMIRVVPAVKALIFKRP